MRCPSAGQRGAAWGTKLSNSEETPSTGWRSSNSPISPPDANNLCWRLDLALQGLADPEILDGYSNERKPHIKWYIQFSVDTGRVICVTDAKEAAERDRRLIAEHAQQAETGPISPHDAVLGPARGILPATSPGSPRSRAGSPTAGRSDASTRRSDAAGP